MAFFAAYFLYLLRVRGCISASWQLSIGTFVFVCRAFEEVYTWSFFPPISAGAWVHFYTLATCVDIGGIVFLCMVDYYEYM